MATVYNPSPARLGSITLAADGDAFTAASFAAPIQATADGVALLQSTVASLSALAAIAAPANGDVRHVIGFGWYVFQTTATTGLSPFRVAAADATPGGWVASTAYQTSLSRFLPALEAVRFWSNAVVAKTLSGASFVINTTATMTSLSGGGNLGAGFQPAVNTTNATNTYLYAGVMQSRVIDGATLSSVELVYTPKNIGSAPAVFPSLAVWRAPLTAPATLQGLRSAGDFLVDSGGTYIATTRTLSYACDQNNVIDANAYVYGFVIGDEHGANTDGARPCLYHGLRLNFTNVPDARR